MNLQVDPRGAAKEVARPAVRWEDTPDAAPEATWEGVLAGDPAHPQAELRRELENGVDIVVYVGLGEIKRRQGVSPAGVIISTNGSVVMSWRDWYTLHAAVEEATIRLEALQTGILRNVGEVLAGREQPAVEPPAPDA